MKIYLIDAFNLMHKIPDTKKLLNKSKEIACESLTAKFNDIIIRNNQGNMYKLVFDGNFSSQSAKNNNLTIIESRGKSADEVIKKMIDKAKNKRIISVVSSDTEVHNYARLNSCEVVSSEKFISLYFSRLKQKHTKGDNLNFEKPTYVSKSEIDELKKLFGVD